MNLIIDIGNSQSKAALFSADKLKTLTCVRGEITTSKLKKFVDTKGKIDAVILSSVINHLPSLNQFLSKKFNFIELNTATRLPIKNLYESPGTLGKDRIANAAGANFLFPDQNILSIDAGTCIKYDFVNSKNQYLGGAISPGIEMRFQALHHFTAQLPLVEKFNLNTNLVGKNTNESIISGVQNGVNAEVSGIINRYKEKYKNVIIIFTGGDHHSFKNFVSKKNRIFAVPDLTLLGLNTILNYNNEVV